MEDASAHGIACRALFFLQKARARGKGVGWPKRAGYVLNIAYLLRVKKSTIY